MEIIRNKEYEGERPLYCSHNLRLEHVTIHKGESSIKECSNIEADQCQFEGKYVFWETDGFTVTNSLFTEGARSSLWYSRNCKMQDCRVEAPKMFREMENIDLERVQLVNAQETFWHCRNIKLRNVEADKADYLFMFSENIDIDGYVQHGNYGFQYARNVVIRNATLHSKDAFWSTENVTVYDSTIIGEYLAWYSKNLRLVRCHIEETQPLCYCENLILEDCTFGQDADLAFEYSTIEARINGNVTSIKNPTSGRIHVTGGIGELIIDENIKQPADCIITQGE